jgi:uncharacterized phiE125 gp8 family phage protein
MTLTIAKGGPLAVPLEDLKTYLKIGLDEEDAALTHLLHAAREVAERFLGHLLVARSVQEVLGVGQAWQKLAIRPVRSIGSVAGLDAEGAEFPLPVGGYAIDIDSGGTGWVRIVNAGAATRICVTYSAGLASSEAEVPDALQHAIVRMAGELHARREGLEGELPASVAAMLRPWRRMTLA